MSDDFERRLREAMHAVPTPDSAGVERRVLAGAQERSASGRSRWLWPGLSAAAVVVVAAAVTGGVLLVRDNASKPATAPPEQSASTAAPPSTGPTATGPTATGPTPAGPAGGPAGRPVPTGFVPYSSTWISATQGWVLGTAPCATGTCTSIVRTRDGAASWQGIPAPAATLPSNGAAGQVKAVRFASVRDGWAFGTVLYSTHDGGATWVRQSLSSVVALESSGGQTWAVVSSGPSATVYRAMIGSDNWQPISPAINTNGRAIQLVVHGSDWILNVGVLYRGSGTGAPTPLATPCAVESGTTLAIADAQHLDALCASGGAAGSSQQQLRGSTDGGAHWTDAGRPVVAPLNVTGMADNADGVLLISASSGGSVVRRTTDDGQHFSTPLTAEVSGGIPWVDLGFTTASQSSVVQVGTAMYVSHDAGATWSAVRF